MGMGLQLDRHRRLRPALTEAERAKQLLEQRLAEIAEDALHEYQRFVQHEWPRCERYPHNRDGWQLIAIALGPRVELWVEQNAGLAFVWEQADQRHPGGYVRLEGAVESEGACVAWPTKHVREAIRDGWLVYCGDAASWAASRGVETNRPNITAEQAGDALMASLERQFIAATRDELLAEARDREARRRGSWLKVSVAWNAELEAQLQQRLREYRRHPGHLW